MAAREVIPNLVVAQRVIDKMAAAATEHIEDETGEAMVGLVVESAGVPTIYLLDTISPDESAVRQLHTFQQGDERQDELIWWLQENWHIKRRKYDLEAKWHVPLRYLGDWHKQPGFMIAPSGGDLMTALSWVDDDENEMDYLVAPIVTLGHPTTLDTEATNVNYVTVPKEPDNAMRVDFWYIHKNMRVFQPINPVIYPDDQLPELVTYPWHLRDEDRATMEFSRLEQNDMFYSLLFYDTDDDLPLEVCITAARMGGSQIFLIATQHDYPQTPPQVRTTSFVSMQENQTIADVFGQWWDKADPVPEVDLEWTPDTHLIDYLGAVEKALGIEPSAPDKETPLEEEKSAEDS